MKPRFWLIAPALLLAVSTGIVSLVYSRSGTRWLVRQGMGLLPGTASVQSIDGRLTDRLTLNGFDLKYDGSHVEIGDFVFAWRPAALLHGALAIGEIRADQVKVALAPSEKPAEKKPFSLKDLPRLPIDLFIDRAEVDDLTILQGDSEQRVDTLQFAVRTENGRLRLTGLTAKSGPATLNAQGALTLRGEPAFELSAGFKADTAEQGVWQGQARLAGDAARIELKSSLAAPFKLAIQGEVQNWAEAPKLDLNADWQNLAWPFASKTPQVQSPQGTLQVTGPLDSYRMRLTGDLSPQGLPNALLTMNGEGGKQAFKIEKLAVESPDGTLNVTGPFAWTPEMAFDLKLSARGFNPGMLSPKLQGKISTDIQARGRLADESLQVDAQIEKLFGTLRGYPVNGQGRLRLADDELAVDALTLASGKNTVALNGTLGAADSTLDLKLAAPDLHAFWPDLGGSFRGEGRLQGALQNPSLALRGNGLALRFAENRIKRLDLDIDYRADPHAKSGIRADAQAIDSGDLHIDAFMLEGTGSLRQHAFTSRIDSARANLQAMLEGGLDQGAWKGRLTQLDMTRLKDKARWQLEKPWPMRTEKRADGLRFELDRGCLAGNRSSLCAAGRFEPNGDFKAEAQAADFSLDLFQDYFPKGFDLKGLIDADVDIKRNEGMLDGRYRIALPGRTTLHWPATPEPAEIDVGPASVAGELRGSRLAALADLRLADQDFLRADLALNTGEPKTLAGTIEASIRRLDLIETFVPQLSNTQGHLQADLQVEGPLARPAVAGTLDLSDGRLALAKPGLSLNAIELHARASGRRESRIQLDGTAELVLNPGRAAEKNPLRERLKTNADIRLNDESLSAAVDLGLGERNRIAANLKTGAGEPKDLSGRITASLGDWRLLAPLAGPQLANPRGRIAADLGIAGSLDNPAISGDLTLADGGVDVVPLGISLQQVELRAAATRDGTPPIRITGSARSGDGVVTLDGAGDLAGNAALRLTGKRFQAVRLPEAQVTIAPDLLLQASPRRRKVEGRVNIPEARIELKELPENAVKVSEDEVIVGEKQKPEAAVPPIRLDADIEVVLGPQVTFSGMGLKSGVTGNVRIRQADQKTTANGAVELKDATYRSYGQDLSVNQGKIAFNGPLDNPRLDIEARRVSKDEKVTAIVNVSGPLKAPKTRLSSNPPLPETDVLAYLVTGSPLNQVGQAQGSLVASAALAYGSSQVGWIANKLGLSEFEVKQGKTLEDTLVQAGRYLAPGFYVGAKVGLFNNQAALVMKRKLTDNLNLETQAGTAQRVKINYEFDGD